MELCAVACSRLARRERIHELHGGSALLLRAWMRLVEHWLLHLLVDVIVNLELLRAQISL